MKPYFVTFLIIIIPLSTPTTTPRRILHQPLLPASPPSSSSTVTNPFFHENPNQPPPSPPPPPVAAGVSTANTTITHPVAPQPTNKPAKKIAVVISVGIVTLGMLSGLAFFLYKKHKARQETDSTKLVGGNSFRETNAPPSNFLYIGTVEPRTTISESTNDINSNGSPYNKLHSVKRSDRYRPSPELQPLPPLKKLQQQPVKTEFVNSPFSDEEDEEEDGTNDFYTPNGSIDSYNSKRSYMKSSSSKRTSPRSRLSVSSSPDEKQPQQLPRLAKFAAPPPGPDMTHLQQKARIPVPPPQQPKTEPIIPKIVKTMSFNDVDASKPKLKPLHWDKVRASSDRDTVWDHLKSSSFQLNEDVMESLFGCNSGGGSGKKQENGKSVVPPTEKRVLDPNKSQNIAILLRALNVTHEEVSRGLLQGNPDSLDAQLLETLVKMAPTKEEEIKLKHYRGDISKLGSAERFLKAILDIPFAFSRAEAMLYRANFENEVKYLRSSFQTLEAASEELKKSRLFFKLLEAILRAGNRMNVGTNRGEATAFKLDTLLKLVDIKGADGKTTLLHFVVQEIIRSEDTNMLSVPKTETNPVFNEGTFKKQGLQILRQLNGELSHITKAAGMDSDVLNGYVTKLEMGLRKIQSEVDDTREIQGNYFGSMRVFIKEAEIELTKIKIDEKKALASVKDVTEYFHGDTMKERVNPFRIFMIVRDFLGILEHVCKEVGQMQDRIIVGTASSFRVPSSAPVPVVTRYSMRNTSSSSDEESSYSSPRDR